MGVSSDKNEDTNGEIFFLNTNFEIDINNLYDENSWYSSLKNRDEEIEGIKSLIIEEFNIIMENTKKSLNDYNKNEKFDLSLTFLKDMHFVACTSNSEIKLSEGLIIHYYNFFKGFLKAHHNSYDFDDGIVEMIPIKFILYHEIGHVIHGHIKLLENRKSNNEAISTLDQKSLEYDADAFALSRIYDEYNGVIKNSIDNCNNSEEFKKGFELMLLVLIFEKVILGIVIAFFIIRKPDDFNKFDTKKHPPTFYREVLAIESLKSLLASKINVQKIFADCELTLTKYVGYDDSIMQKFVADILDNIVHVDDIIKNWNERVKYEVKKYSRFPVEGIDFVFEDGKPVLKGTF
ncbi:hypothetical protein [Paenibacillus sp. FSL M7-1046]|uniref:hypothetical protein n=1 Tax=Paenibacillus sp. FSL M7-1046 TaxID=2975315 RepID=UPI0030FAD4F8